MSRPPARSIHNSHGELVAYAGRAIDGSDPRYKFPTAFHKSQELYNLHNLHRVIGVSTESSTVVVVEGFFEGIKVTAARAFHASRSWGANCPKHKRCCS